MAADELVYSGTLALLAFVPVAISQMVSFYEQERIREVEESELTWFRRSILAMTAGLWLIIVANLSALEAIIQWTNFASWDIDPVSISIVLVTVSLAITTIFYTFYIILFFNRLDWNNSRLK